MRYEKTVGSNPNDSRKRAHQLVVIGNGFDLASGLRSSYGDFFGDLRATVFPFVLDGSSWGDYLKDKGLTIWDVIFCERLGWDARWFDVEADINRWVNGAQASSINLVQGVLTVLSRQQIGTLPSASASATLYQYLGKPHENQPEIDVALYILDTQKSPTSGRWTRSDILAILLDELHLLEDRFSGYLEEQVRMTVPYKKNALELLDAITEDSIAPDEFRYETTILNFNYTSPYGEGYDWNKDGMISVHGHIGSEIIFGIDGEGRMDDEEALPFTKTYRVMGANVDGITRVAHSVSSDLGRPTSIIKFFGHSLSDADYSYFQAVFDIVNLYDGDTELVFYYRPHGTGDKRTLEAKTRNDMMRKVTSLLVAYGKTLDNPDHGKNLIHRLLLEGRLRVKRV